MPYVLCIIVQQNPITTAIKFATLQKMGGIMSTCLSITVYL